MAFSRPTRVSGTDGVQNPFILRSTQGLLSAVNIASNSGGIFFVKVYDKATAPTNSDVPVLILPGYISTDKLLTTYIFPNPVFFGSGISIRVVGGVADNDTTGIAAAAFFVNLISSDAW